MQWANWLPLSLGFKAFFITGFFFYLGFWIRPTGKLLHLQVGSGIWGLLPVLFHRKDFKDGPETERRGECILDLYGI